MAKISEQQKIKKEKELELKRKKEEERKAKEVEKKQKAKEWREQMDKDRIKYVVNKGTKSWKELAREDVDSYIRSSNKINLSTKSKIYIDLTTITGHYFIQRDEDENDISKDEFTNCLCIANDDINQRIECKIGITHISGFRPEVTKLVYPINNGKIDDYDILSLFLNYILGGQISFELDETSILFAEPINCLTEDREKLIQIFFEDYCVKRVFLIKPSILTLLSEGKSTGIVVELGEDTTNFIPIFDKFWIRHATTSINFGRKDMIEYMKDLIKVEHHITISSQVAKYIVNQLCYISQFYEQEKIDGEYYKLEERNQEIYIKEPRIKCPEILFRPEINSQTSQYKGIQYYLLDSINKCDKELKNEFLKNIVLTGVNSNISGLKERLRREICSNLNLSESEVKITINEEGVQQGLKTLFSDPVFEQMWITKEEYEDYNGARIAVHKSF